jgi:hypothetical protein
MIREGAVILDFSIIWFWGWILRILLPFCASQKHRALRHAPFGKKESSFFGDNFSVERRFYRCRLPAKTEYC